MNLDKYDRIVLRSQEDIDKLFEWRDKNSDLVRHYKPILKEGIITSFNGIYYHFVEHGVIVRYRAFHKTEILSFTIVRYSNGKYKVLSENHINTMPEEQVIDNIMTVVTVHSTLMAYMEHYTENVTERKQRITKQKKGKGGSKSKARTVKIGRKVYDIEVPNTVLTEKREYARHVEAFPVRRHPRTYKKSGKTIWIESYVKGDKDKLKPEPKTYHL